MLTYADVCFRMAGFLGAWGGLINTERDDPNLYLFQLLKRHPDDKAHVGLFANLNLSLFHSLNLSTKPLAISHTKPLH